MSERVVTATEFKAKCLGLLDEMEKGGETITITKRGKPVAVLGPPKRKAWKSPAGSWKGRIRIVGDIVNGNPELWDVIRGEYPADRAIVATACVHRLSLATSDQRVIDSRLVAVVE